MNSMDDLKHLRAEAEMRRHLEAGRRAGGKPLPPEVARAAAKLLEPSLIRRLLRRPTAAQRAYAEGRAEGERLIASLRPAGGN